MSVDTDFSAGNQLPASFIGIGKPGTVDFYTRLKNRDIELMGLMSPFGPPKSVGAGSLFPISGDVNGDETVTINETKNGLFYYNNYTINSGITVDSTLLGLIIIARTKITIAGTIDVDGVGRVGGASLTVAGAGNPGLPGMAGTGGGGGAGSSGNDGGRGGGVSYHGEEVVIGASGGLGASSVGGSGQGASATVLSYLNLLSLSVLGGAGGGSGGYDGGGGAVSGIGGKGGGSIILVAPTIDITNGTLLSRGTSGGVASGIFVGGGGGGAGGLIYLRTKTLIATGHTIDVSGGIGGSATSGNGGPGGAGMFQADVF